MILLEGEKKKVNELLSKLAKITRRHKIEIRGVFVWNETDRAGCILLGDNTHSKKALSWNAISVNLSAKLTKVFVTDALHSMLLALKCTRRLFLCRYFIIIEVSHVIAAEIYFQINRPTLLKLELKYRLWETAKTDGANQYRRRQVLWHALKLKRDYDYVRRNIHYLYCITINPRLLLLMFKISLGVRNHL